MAKVLRDGWATLTECEEENKLGACDREKMFLRLKRMQSIWRLHALHPPAKSKTAVVPGWMRQLSVGQVVNQGSGTCSNRRPSSRQVQAPHARPMLEEARIYT